MRQRSTRPLAVTGALLLVGALACCTAPSPSEHQRSTSTPHSDARSDGTRGAVIIPTDVPNDTSTREGTSVTGCNATDGGWTMTGTATNDGRTSAVYLVTVFFTNASATVLATAETTVEVAAGGTGGWKADAQFDAPEDTACVLRGVGPA
jgi:hypothetical protein